MPVATISSASNDYLVLTQEMREARLLDRRPWYYSMKIGLTGAALVAGWVALVVVGNSWAMLWVAALLGVMFTQMAFVGHDAGHQQIFNSHRANRLVGLVVGNVMTGVSFGWWVPKHNAHHAYPNQIGRDPDIGTGVIAFPVATDISARRQGAARVLAGYQAWLFFPLLLLQGMGLHVTGVQVLARRRDRTALVEGLLLAVHFALYATVVLWVLAPLQAVVFVAVQQGMFGLYLGCSFAPNHKGMPMIERDADLSFARRQVITARNVRGGWFATLMLGGLNYQIEHHLFPMMPRPNLVRAQRIIQRFCRDHDLPYCQDSLAGSYRRALRHLGGVGSESLAH